MCEGRRARWSVRASCRGHDGYSRRDEPPEKWLENPSSHFRHSYRVNGIPSATFSRRGSQGEKSSSLGIVLWRRLLTNVMILIARISPPGNPIKSNDAVGKPACSAHAGPVLKNYLLGRTKQSVRATCF